MMTSIESGFIVKIFFFEEWTASFFVHRLGWWTSSTLLRNLVGWPEQMLAMDFPVSNKRFGQEMN